MASPSEAGSGTEGRLAKVTAVVRVERAERVEQRLLELGVPGASITRVKGFGEYVDLFATGWTTDHARFEIFVELARAHDIAKAIVEAARTGGAGDGIVAIQEVAALYRIRSGEVSGAADPEG